MVSPNILSPERKNDMTTKDKIARRKLSLLDLAAELSNVSRACKVMGYSRQQFYEIRRNFQTYGAEGLVDRLPGAKGPHPNRVAAEVEQAYSTIPSPTPATGLSASNSSFPLKPSRSLLAAPGPVNRPGFAGGSNS